MKIFKTLGIAASEIQMYFHCFSDPVKPEQSEISRQPLKCHLPSFTCNETTAGWKKVLFAEVMKCVALHGS
jgi:hypothetical protein